MSSETSVGSKEISRLKTLDSATLEKIESALLNWESVDAAVRAPVEATLHDSDAAAERVMEAISASEQLSEVDLAIRINTRE